ncbi:MAG: hypothetical protein JXI43_06475 [Tissierellales bacterium]|nr:hypothetical protein [Tissierellales bacterium]
MNDSQDSEHTLEIKRPISISLSCHDRTMAVRKIDWERINRNISRIDSPKRWLQNIGTTMIGASITAYLSLIPLSQSKECPTWANSLCWIIGISFSIVGIALMIVDKHLMSSRANFIDEIKEDMTEIEKTFSSE